MNKIKTNDPQPRIAVFFPLKVSNSFNHIYNFLFPFIDAIYDQGLKLGKYIKLFSIDEIQDFSEQQRLKRYTGAITLINQRHDKIIESWRKLHNLIPCINILNEITHAKLERGLGKWTLKKKSAEMESLFEFST